MRRRWNGATPARRRSRTGRVPMLEAVEERLLMAAPVIEAINLGRASQVPAGKTLLVPVTASDADGDPISFTVQAGGGAGITAQVLPAGSSALRLNVAGFGSMTFQLLPNFAPETVRIISELANNNFYDNVIFHRIIANFMIQGGDPTGTGSGDPGFLFDDEFHRDAIFSGHGQLAMANRGMDTNTSQFFITVSQPRHLDFNHTIFGQLLRGQSVLEALRVVPIGANDRPVNPPVITSAEIIQNTTDAVLLLRAPLGATGNSTITVTASDGKGGVATQSFQATAFADTVNTPPILGPVANRVTTVGTPVSIPLTSFDLEGSPVVYDAAVIGGAGNGTSSVAGNVITVTPSPNFTGTFDVLVGVRQASGNTRFDTQRLSVRALPAGSIQGVNVSATERVAFSNRTLGVFSAATAAGATAGQFEATVTWGDGVTGPATVQPVNGGGFQVVGSHRYLFDGNYPVSVQVRNTATNEVFQFNSTAVVARTNDIVRTSADFDGDGRADIAVFRPATSEWLIQQSRDGFRLEAWGVPGLDVPIPADYDGDGRADIAVFRPSTGQWIMRQSTAGFRLEAWGVPGLDQPIPADFDGDRRADLAVFRPSTGQWILMRSRDGFALQAWGVPGLDQPIPADFDGDRRADIAVFRPGEGRWLVLPSGGGFRDVFWGVPGLDEPILADFDGDGRTDIAVSRPSQGRWLILPSGGGFRDVSWGVPGLDHPVTGDFDGDGRADIGVFRAGIASWLIQQSRDGFRQVGWGVPGLDMPVASAWPTMTLWAGSGTGGGMGMAFSAWVPLTDLGQEPGAPRKKTGA